MEPKFQTSFIPKNPVVSNQAPVQPITNLSFSLGPIVATVLFMISLILSIGLFIYERQINTKISEAKDSIELAKQAFEPKVVADLILISDQMESVKTILNNHVVVSNLLAILQSLTIPSVRFTSFSFDNKPDGNLKVSIEGETVSYSHVARQASVFGSSEFLKNIYFSSIDLSDKGLVTMKLSTDVLVNAVSYAEAIKRLSLSN